MTQKHQMKVKSVYNQKKKKNRIPARSIFARYVKGNRQLIANRKG
jgi:hypothetical protein